MNLFWVSAGGTWFTQTQEKKKPLPLTLVLVAAKLFGKGMIQRRKFEVIGEHLGINDCRMLADSKPKRIFNNCGLKKVGMDRFKHH